MILPCGPRFAPTQENRNSQTAANEVRYDGCAPAEMNTAWGSALSDFYLISGVGPSESRLYAHGHVLADYYVTLRQVGDSPNSFNPLIQIPQRWVDGRERPRKVQPGRYHTRSSMF
jgi:hypothetical protein